MRYNHHLTRRGRENPSPTVDLATDRLRSYSAARRCVLCKLAGQDTAGKTCIASREPMICTKGAPLYREELITGTSRPSRKLAPQE